MIYLLLFAEFFKIGLFCFGGAFGMIPLIEEAVLKHGWMTADAFYSLIGVCESTPGPIAVNMATYVGATQGGPLGGVVATVGVVTPSFLIIILIASILKNFTSNRYFKGFLRGVKPVIIALILSTGAILFARAVGYVSITELRFDAVSTVVLGLLLCAMLGARLLKKKIPSVLLIVISAVLGVAVSLLMEGL